MSADLERLAGLIREDGHSGVANMVNMVARIGRRLGVRDTYSEVQPEIQTAQGVVRVNNRRGQALIEILKNSQDPLSTHDLSVVSGYGYEEIRQGLKPYRQDSTVLTLRRRGGRAGGGMLWKYNPDQEPK